MSTNAGQETVTTTTSTVTTPAKKESFFEEIKRKLLGKGEKNTAEQPADQQITTQQAAPETANAEQPAQKQSFFQKLKEKLFGKKQEQPPAQTAYAPAATENTQQATAAAADTSTGEEPVKDDAVQDLPNDARPVSVFIQKGEDAVENAAHAVGEGAQEIKDSVTQ